MPSSRKNIVTGVDIGGSHISAALVDLEDKAIVEGTFVRRHLNPHADAQTITNEWSDTIRAVNSDGPIGNVGIAMPGPFDYENGISFIKGQNKYEQLYKVNIKNLLAHALNITAGQITFRNDAACFLQGEVFAGTMISFNHCVGITLGTGFGSAVYKNFSAENMDLWKLKFRDSIVEEYFSTRWFVQTYYRATGNPVRGVKELASAAYASDKAAVEVFTEFSANLKELLAIIIQVEEPGAIVIGGNIANAYPLFGSAILETKKAFPHVSIEKASLFESGSIVGAASFFQHQNIS